LSDVYDEHPVYTDREHSREQFAVLQTKGEKIKQAAAPKKEANSGAQTYIL